MAADRARRFALLTSESTTVKRLTSYETTCSVSLWRTRSGL